MKIESLSEWLSGLTRRLTQYDDTDVILDSILTEARNLCGADAGTIYLVEKETLVFSYTHNATLFPVETAYKYAYANARIPMTETSIAGYCALYRRNVNLPDVRQMPAGLPFKFNDSFDLNSGYRTVSMLAMPLTGRGAVVRGVMQLINCMGPDGPIPFDVEKENLLGLLSVQASQALERGLLIGDMLSRMQAMAALNDPLETGAHARRVGAIAAEVYQRWAEKKGVPLDERRQFRAYLRLAASMHDLGKVAIPREILKKKGKLTPDEYQIMQRHCAEGAKLFDAITVDGAGMARDIILHHHQKWNGQGYTGEPDIPTLSGEAIPLAARITAVADVFDALVSPRCYKPAWPWERAVAMLLHDSGTHFDPLVVDAFMDIQDLVRRIYERFPDAPADLVTACVTDTPQ